MISTYYQSGNIYQSNTSTTTHIISFNPSTGPQGHPPQRDIKSIMSLSSSSSVQRAPARGRGSQCPNQLCINKSLHKMPKECTIPLVAEQESIRAEVLNEIPGKDEIKKQLLLEKEPTEYTMRMGREYSLGIDDDEDQLSIQDDSLSVKKQTPKELDRFTKGLENERPSTSSQSSSNRTLSAIMNKEDLNTILKDTSIITPNDPFNLFVIKYFSKIEDIIEVKNDPDIFFSKLWIHFKDQESRATINQSQIKAAQLHPHVRGSVLSSIVTNQNRYILQDLPMIIEGAILANAYHVQDKFAQYAEVRENELQQLSIIVSGIKDSVGEFENKAEVLRHNINQISQVTSKLEATRAMLEQVSRAQTTSSPKSNPEAPSQVPHASVPKKEQSYSSCTIPHYTYGGKTYCLMYSLKYKGYILDPRKTEQANANLTPSEKILIAALSKLNPLPLSLAIMIPTNTSQEMLIRNACNPDITAVELLEYARLHLKNSTPLSLSTSIVTLFQSEQ